MKILITGANGQLGREMRAEAARRGGHECLFTDVDELDICDPEAVDDRVRRTRPDAIVNCAAYTAVDKAEDDAEACARLNHAAPCHLARAAEACGAALLQISTDYVFDGTACTPYTEEMTTNPRSVYGRTKADCERDVTRLCSRAMVVRTAWLYSAHGNNFVRTMLRLGRERDTLGVVCDQVGTPTYARDLAVTLFRVLEQGVRPGIYHYTNEGVCSWYDLAVAALRMAGVEGCRVKPITTAQYPTRAARPCYSVLSKNKIRQDYGLVIPHWEDSLRECVEQLQKNQTI